MLLFDEMESINKLKIFNKYAYYPLISKFMKDYTSNDARIYLGKTQNISVKETDTLKEELMHFEKKSIKNQQPITNGTFCLDILKIIN